MDATPALVEIGKALDKAGLEAVLIGNATADGLQVDFMTAIHGLRSYEGVRDRAASIRVGDADIRVASLADIIKSKRAAGRAQDRAVLALLERAHAEAKKSPGASRASQARKRAKRR